MEGLDSSHDLRLKDVRLKGSIALSKELLLVEEVEQVPRVERNTYSPRCPTMTSQLSGLGISIG